MRWIITAGSLDVFWGGRTPKRFRSVRHQIITSALHRERLLVSECLTDADA